VLIRLVVVARAALTSSLSSLDISGATYYRFTCTDLRPAGPSANWFAVTAWQRLQLGVGGKLLREGELSSQHPRRAFPDDFQLCTELRSMASVEGHGGGWGTMPNTSRLF